VPIYYDNPTGFEPAENTDYVLPVQPAGIDGSFHIGTDNQMITLTVAPKPLVHERKSTAAIDG
jgi:hypothetical protein